MSIYIYSSLFTKSHNIHYLNRYIKFIKNLESQIISEFYFEKHHIAPKSMFPEFENDSLNFVSLTARQHFIAHWLLWKAFENSQMTFAFYSMRNISKHKINSKTYSILKNDQNKFSKQYRHSAETKEKMRIKKLGTKHSEESKIKISNAVSGKNNPMYGKPGTRGNLGKTHSEETKIKMRKPKTKQDLLECPYCFLIGKRNGMTRWHFDKCKLFKQI